MDDSHVGTCTFMINISTYMKKPKMPHNFWANIVNFDHSADGGSGRVEPACKPPCIVEQRTNIFSYCGISCKNT